MRIISKKNIYKIFSTCIMSAFLINPMYAGATQTDEGLIVGGSSEAASEAAEDEGGSDEGLILPEPDDYTSTEENEPDESYTPYISFGADLSSSEKNTVYKYLGVTSDTLGDYKTISVTNKEEYDFLGSYISASQIGTRALSSVKVVKTTAGSGIKVVTYNINYCTAAMYQNALITAGISDADVTVAGPFSLSGTAALVGAMKSYSAMTGEDISADTMDTATDELITTAEIAEQLGDEKATQLIAAAKQKIFEENLATREDIQHAVEYSADALDIDITDEQRDKVTDLMMKIKDQDIDVHALKEQAKNIFDELKDAGLDFTDIDTEKVKEKAGGFFSSIFEAISDFFSGLFG